jgi:hypothetical protein
MTAQQRIANVQIANPIVEIGRGKEDLSGMMSVSRKAFFVGLDQVSLTDGRDGLKSRQVFWTGRQSQPPDARRDRSAADQNDSLSASDQFNQLSAEIFDLITVQLAFGRRQCPGSNLNDPDFGGIDRLKALCGIGHISGQKNLVGSDEAVCLSEGSLLYLL